MARASRSGKNTGSDGEEATFGFSHDVEMYIGLGSNENEITARGHAAKNIGVKFGAGVKTPKTPNDNNARRN